MDNLECCDLCGDTVPLRLATWTGCQILCSKCNAEPMNAQILGELPDNDPPSNEPLPPDFNPLADFEVEYYDYDCGSPCTPNGCPGHSTTVPVAFSLGGVTFHVDGAEAGDFPSSSGSNHVNRVEAVVNAIAVLVEVSRMAKQSIADSPKNDLVTKWDQPPVG